MTRAGQLIASAVAEAIAAAITASIPGATAADADRAAHRAVTDLGADGWHITARPLPDPIPEPTMPHALQPRDLVIIAGLARGMADPDIADRLGMPVGSLKQRLHRIYRNSRARGAAHLVRIAYDAGLLAGLTPETVPDTGLTDYQAQTLALLADGLTYREMAMRQGISLNTVKATVGRLYRNLGITGTTPTRAAAQAVARGYQQQLLPARHLAGLR